MKAVATNTGRDMGRCNVRPLVCHRRSYGTCAHICSLPTGAVTRHTGRRTYGMSTRIHSTRATVLPESVARVLQIRAAKGT